MAIRPLPLPFPLRCPPRSVQTQSMPSQTALRLAKCTTTAIALRTSCETVPALTAYQPLAASAVKVCIAASSVKRNNASKLAIYAAGKTAALASAIKPQITHELLEAFQRTLGEMQRHIETMPENSNRVSDYRFNKESGRLKRELDTQLKVLLRNVSAVTPSQSDSALELVALGARVSAALFDLNVLDFLKPVIGTVALICETVKTVKTNHASALKLVQRVNTVMECVFERASRTEGVNEHALRTLHNALEDILSHLASLQKRRRASVWLLANQEKERVAQLSGALNDALALFSTSTILVTASNTAQLTTLLSAVRRLDGDVGGQLTAIHADLTKLSEERLRLPKALDGYVYPFPSAVFFFRSSL
ncbi:hypothetical protein B0H16DRAFT_1600939 [Mycena metata]|uniref:Uncharacterized protein n=1 Tax=Mycena metata TaxID=1033252 RepID=A0AAD7HJU6_9AGAR|nr:hypothetical protein B0H16DRAFT_1600939 [Mycena metata]